MPARHLGVGGELADAIVATVRTPLVVLNDELRVLKVNSAFCRTFDVSPGDTEGQMLASLGNRQWDIPRLRALLDRVLTQQTSFDDYEVEHVFPTIGHRVMHLNARWMPGAADRDTLILLSIEDVTERRNSELAARRYTVELERSNRALEEFAHVASHDLQEPLRKIVMFGDRLAQTAGAALEERPRDYLERMLRSTRRMQELIDGLLQYSRVTTRARPFESVDLGALAAEVIHDLENALERNGAVVRCGELPVIDGDPLQLRQLLQNLLANAIKFHAPDVKPVVQVAGRTRDDGASVDITVQDNGIGFSAEHAERIFGVFQRLHPRTDYEGSGIGLAICRRIVERHGGTITARPNPEGGATFVVTLPVHQYDDTPSSERPNEGTS